MFKTKSGVLAVFIKFKAMVETQFSTKIETLHTNGGGELHALTSILSSNSIIHHISCPCTSHQNGNVERKNRHVVEVGLALLAHSHVPHHFWSFAFHTAMYLINPISLPFFSIQCLTTNFLNPFGSTCFPFLRPFNDHKLQFLSRECIFLGYTSSYKGYLCLDPCSNRVYISRHVIFNKNSCPFQSSLKSKPSLPPSSLVPPCITVSPTSFNQVFPALLSKI